MCTKSVVLQENSWFPMKIVFSVFWSNWEKIQIVEHFYIFINKLGTKFLKKLTKFLIEKTDKKTTIVVAFHFIKCQLKIIIAGVLQSTFFMTMTKIGLVRLVIFVKNSLQMSVNIQSFLIQHSNIKKQRTDFTHSWTSDSGWHMPPLVAIGGQQHWGPPTPLMGCTGGLLAEKIDSVWVWTLVTRRLHAKWRINADRVI